jgi:hypothetical protein
MNVQTHIRSCNRNRYFFKNNHISALTFRCKLCIPLGTSLELLRLLLSAESAFIFRCKLCIPLGTTLELLRLLLSAESELCIPLGTTLELLRLLLSAESELCIPLGTTLELLCLLLLALDGAFSVFTFTFLGDFAFIELKKEITCVGPIKNLSPPLERKRVP